MADKKLSIADKVFLVVLLCGLSAIFGCASQSSREDSTHYIAQVQQGYPCPECGFSISDKDVSPNIRIGNKCPNCGKIFFGAPVEKKSQEGERMASYGIRSHGPRLVYESNTNVTVLNVFGERFEETPTGYWWLSFWLRDWDVDRNDVRPTLSTRFNYRN